MSIYTSILELAIDEDYLNENSMTDFIDRQVDKLNGLTKLGITRDDLSNPSKIKKVINDINLKESNKKVQAKALIVILISLATCISYLAISDNIRNNPSDYISQMLALIGVSIGNFTFSQFGLTNDYQKLISALDRAIDKNDNEIHKENRGGQDKARLRELKATRDKLSKNRNMVIKKYDSESKKLGIYD